MFPSFRFAAEGFEVGSVFTNVTCVGSQSLPFTWSLLLRLDLTFRASRKAMLTFCRAMSLETSTHQPESSLRNLPPTPFCLTIQTTEYAISVFPRFVFSFWYSSTFESMIFRNVTFPGCFMIGQPRPNKTSFIIGHSILLKGLFSFSAFSFWSFKSSHFRCCFVFVSPVVALTGICSVRIPKDCRAYIHSTVEPIWILMCGRFSAPIDITNIALRRRSSCGLDESLDDAFS
mmetsp:Transcript_7841/g.19214  ORF Transcript_7841/g.19214 Transcript_7841/m.19214 type:complete len:231 (-) Transcript_7841:1645-2337(-)